MYNINFLGALADFSNIQLSISKYIDNLDLLSHFFYNESQATYARRLSQFLHLSLLEHNYLHHSFDNSDYIDICGNSIQNKRMIS